MRFEVFEAFLIAEMTPVVYVCPNNQLIQQTQARCAELGFSPVTRYRGNWHENSVLPRHREAWVMK